MKKYVLFALIALFFVSSHSWAQYVKVTAPDGTVSWVIIKGYEYNENFRISSYAIDENTKGSLDLNEVWSESGGKGTHYQVTSIGSNAFFDCSGLTYVEIPSSVTSIEDWAFMGCSGLTSVAIPYGLTSIGIQAFAGCSGLTSVVIPSSVTSIDMYAFQDCYRLTSIEIPYGVTSIGERAFLSCTGLTSVVIPSSVTSLHYTTFFECTGLTSIVVESGNSFYDSRNDCNAIIETASNTLITGCNNTKIPSSVTSIGIQAFQNCTGLTSVTIPNSVTSIGSYAFNNCSGLTSVTIPNSVTSIEEGAFHGCSGLTSIFVESGNTAYDSRNNCNAIIETASNTLIAGCQNTKIPSSVTSIGYAAFYSCTRLTSITIPNSVTSIGNAAFSGCTGLTSIVIPSSVTSIGGEAFWRCSGLTSITSYITNVFKTGSSAFIYCDNATLYVPKGLVSAYRYKTDWNSLKKIEEIRIPMVISCNNKGKVLVNGTEEFTNDMGEVNINDGVDNTFIFQPNNNCELRQVLIDGLDVTLSVENNQLTTKVNEGSKMMVIFDKTGYDVNGDGNVDISDVVKLVNFILGQ